MSWWPRPGIAKIERAKLLRHDTAAWLPRKGKAALHVRDDETRLVLLADLLRAERLTCRTSAERQAVDELLADAGRMEKML